MDMLKNMQKMQEGLGDFQEKLARIKVQGSSGGGMVVIEMNARSEILSVHLEPEIVASGDVEMLEDLITAALHSVLENVKDTASDEAVQMAASLGIQPGAFSGRQ
jgi:DNA-binding YbaB/EbfC family protein